MVLRGTNPTPGKPGPYIRLRSELERTEVELRRFAEAVDKVIAIHRDSWRPGSKSEAQWRASLRDYATPRLGDKRVDRITTADVLAVLVPIRNVERQMARRVHQRVGAEMKWAVAKGYRDDNPAGDAIGAAVPRHGGSTRHFPALPHGQAGAALGIVRASGVWIGTKLAFEFLALTAARSGEARNARWEDIDLENPTWRVPGERMKAGRPHRRVALLTSHRDDLRGITGEAGTTTGSRGIQFRSRASGVAGVAACRKSVVRL